MKGEVDDSGRALIAMPAGAPADADPVNLVAWVDTAFT
jgi:hypothetical protein